MLFALHFRIRLIWESHLKANFMCGEVPEWSNGTDSKSVVPARVPRVRIPVSLPLVLFIWLFLLSKKRNYILRSQIYSHSLRWFECRQARGFEVEKHRGAVCAYWVVLLGLHKIHGSGVQFGAPGFVFSGAPMFVWGERFRTDVGTRVWVTCVLCRRCRHIPDRLGTWCCRFLRI